MPLDREDLRLIMADKAEEQNPIEQLVDLLVYAPIGLLYEYEEVLPKLVKRGKSQVALARVIGQLAVRRQSDPAKVAGDVASLAGNALAKALTQLGEQVGLAPDSSTEEEPEAPPEPEPDAEVRRLPLPIARYDELTAREIIPLLDDLTPEQRARIREHETANRGRKTVLAKLDRLER